MYQNTGVTSSGVPANATRTSTFVDPSTESVLQFAAKTSTVNFKSGSKATLVNLSTRVNRAKVVSDPACTPCGADSVNTTVELRVNVLKGDVDSITALRADVDRAFNQAIASFQFASGLVPPASAVIATE